ncbi:uncharacterized protein IL334_004685 [Kwoniella shivajii]|uniref:Proteophosphoglycan ppg4 n=1 Tax=Kwoniella shivajii TaxID=564305 RepID=A0ABZ1D173_9TREE|nr:hypothetical protein IL334_004685 [Kwoniella shivajii]
MEHRSQRNQQSRWAHQGPTLTPNTTKALIASFATEVPSSTTSPDSLYSANSPTFRSPTFPSDAAFEYDNSLEEVQAEAYDEMREPIDVDDDENFDSPRWTGQGNRRPSWALSAVGSVISLSPRGSFSGSIDSRRGSVPKAPKIPHESRRPSTASFLGFDLASNRRPSSARSFSMRRRSSAYSAGSGSLFDPVEDSRLRNIASLELLRRRFSEVVDVVYSSDEEEEVRGAWAYQWSPATEETDYDEDDSEIHTAPYVPTPDLRTGSIPSLYSNFPLESVAMVPAHPQEDNESSPLDSSPLLQAPRFAIPTMQMIGTPPPPAQPNAILRNRSRPVLNRSATTYVPPRSIGVPPGAAPPRPGLARSVSNPFFSSSTSSQEAAKALEIRAAGSFPIARATPLGTSPLRESMRRQSVVSDGEALRKGSLDDRRRSSLAPIGQRDRRSGSTTSDNEATRRASLAERRLSLVKESALRRMSGDVRRSSKTTPNSRKSSEISLGKQQAQYDYKRPSRDSRKSSVVSIGEYGYLAPQIVIDAPTISPPLQATPTVPSTNLTSELPRLRANAPPSIVLPAYTFPSPASTFTTSPSSSTPRFHPLAHFLNNASPTSSSPQDPLTPNTSRGFFPAVNTTSPKLNMINRGRPIASPEFASSSSLPFRSPQPPSPKSSPVIPVQDVPPLRRPVEAEQPSPKTVGTQRKPVPQLSNEDLRAKRMEEERLRSPSGDMALRQLESRRGATSFAVGRQLASSNEIARVKGADHRRTISIEDMHLVLANERSGELGDTTRPNFRRQATLSPQANKISRPTMTRGISVPVPMASDYTFPSHSSSSEIRRERIAGEPLYQFPQPLSRKTQGIKYPSQHLPLDQRKSITFVEPPSPRNLSAKPKMDRTSSFTRFFQSMSKNHS